VFTIIEWVDSKLIGQTVNEDEEINEALRVETRDGVCRPVARGDASECYASATNLEAPTTNLQNIEDKPADQPAKKRATPYRIHVLPLLNRRGWKQLIYKNICIHPV
jgi:hypothetical protein